MIRAPLWFVASVAVAVIALIAGVGVIWTADRSISDRDDRDDQRSELVDVAQRYFVAATNYDLSTEADITAYKSELAPLMTEAEMRRFESQLDRAVDVLGLDQVKSRSAGTVRRVAVEVVDDDSATVMVTGDVEFDSTRLNSTSHPRWEVSMLLVDGEWLADKRTELGDGRIVTAPAPAGRQ